MTFAATPTARSTIKPLVKLLIGFGALLFVAANAHLLYVAMTSQPDCVDHVRGGQANERSTGFSAAKSSCSPKAAKAIKLSAE
jgi:hypothetical protein